MTMEKGVNITAPGWEIPLFERPLTFQLKCPAFWCISHCSCNVSICNHLCVLPVWNLKLGLHVC